MINPYNIQPLLITNINWPVYCKAMNEVMGFDPMRFLNEAHYDIKDPASFLLSLSEGNILNNYIHLQNIGFICTVTRNQYEEISDFLWQAICIKTVIKRERGTDIILILIGNLLNWLQTIIKCTTEKSSKAERMIANICQLHIEQTGFRELFKPFTKEYQKDETFILRR